MAMPAPEGYVENYRSKVPPHLHEEIFRRVYNGEKCKKIASEYRVSARTLQRITEYGSAAPARSSAPAPLTPQGLSWVDSLGASRCPNV